MPQVDARRMCSIIGKKIARFFLCMRARRLYCEASRIAGRAERGRR